MHRIATSFLILALVGTSPPTPAIASLPSTAIAKATVSVGMTKQQVIAALGQPTQKQGEFWTWLTRTGGYGVTFQNGKVIRCGALQG